MKPMISNHTSQCHLNHELFQFPSVLLSERNPILILNDALDHLNVPYDVNEQTIENILQNLKIFDTTPQPVYWMMMARLFELSLILAGHYADNCEFSVAGDLLVNPRKVLVHRKGYPYPLRKPRHGCITEQLNKKETCRKIVLFQVKHDVTVEVAQPAILPYLLGLIESSFQIASWYLLEAQERMKKIADTIGFLSAWSLSKFEVLYQRLQKMPSETCRFVADHQCNFDIHYFARIGRDIQKLIENPEDHSEFLSL